MSASKPAPAVEVDPVVAAIEAAPLDPNALTPDEAEALDAQIVSARERLALGDRPFRTSSEVSAEIAERAKREG